MNYTIVLGHKVFSGVRSLSLDDAPWYIGTDVASLLGYTDAVQAIQDHVDAKDKFMWKAQKSEIAKCFNNLEEMHTELGNQDCWFINERGLCDLILSSNHPRSLPYKNWLVAEVFPSVKKQGYYSLSKEEQDERIKSEYIALCYRKNKVVTLD